jgi:hypothetical protein
MGPVGLGEIVAILGVVGGGIGFSVGLYQYRLAQKWKRSEFAAKLLEELNNDERLSTCCKFLDYAARTLSVPEAYSTLAEETKCVHSWDRLLTAMKPEEDVGKFDWQQMMYRDLFSYFFDYLDRINHYIGIGLIDLKDVSYLRYWLEQVAAPRFVEEQVFVDFLRAYNYDGVFQLLERFDLTIARRS